MRVPRLSFVLLISLLSIASALGAPRPAVQADLPCPAGQCSVYLPVAVYDIRLDQISTRPSSNLKAGTTLYWRVGISTAAGYQFTEPRSFTTPANDAAPLPGT